VLEDGSSLALALAAAALLGLRHATDPDHIAAVITLTATDGPSRAGAAGRLGLAWGLGHALTLVAFGVPLIVLDARLPDRVEQGAEAAVGALIAFLALRLLGRWRAGCFHTHEHEHEHGLRHVHVHTHVDEEGHAHAHGSRTPLGAFAVGLVHGISGTAGVSILLLATVDSPAVGVAALAVLALGTGVTMALLSSGFGLALGHGPLARRVNALAPILGLASLALGGWWGLGALHVLPNPL
jgi:ABC-type nickel/cobalt efflux system permease component RcnA